MTIESLTRTEYLSGRETINLVFRRPNFWNTTVGLYGLTVTGFEHGRLMRASYLPIRFIDDLLDGDVKGMKDPLGYTLQVQKEIETGPMVYSNRTSELIQRALVELERKAHLDDEPRKDFIRTIDIILFDYYRVMDRQALKQEVLDHYYSWLFDPARNISLIAMDSQLRAINIPTLSIAQGRIYSIRDIENDWIRGIINIPQELLNKVGLTSNSSYKQIISNPEIKQWINNTLLQTKPELLELKYYLKNLPTSEKWTVLICSSLINPMLKFIENYKILE